MEGTRPSVSVCELPTGFLIDGKVLNELTFRELAGPEEEILASKKMLASRRFTKVMGNCIQKIGPLEDRVVISKAIEDMTTSDRIFFLIRLRMISIGELYNFSYPCPECKHVDKLVYDLKGVEFKNPPKADALFKEITLPSKQKVRLRVANSAIEERIEKSANEPSAVTMALFARIESLDDRPPAMSDITNMTLKDRNAIRKAIDDLEGDVDDTFEADCTKCGEHYSASIPIGSADFFFQ